MNRWGPDTAANWEPASELHNGDDRGLTLHWARNYTHEVSDSFQQPVVILQMKKQRPEGLNILAGVSLPESAGVSYNAKGSKSQHSPAPDSQGLPITPPGKQESFPQLPTPPRGHSGCFWTRSHASTSGPLPPAQEGRGCLCFPLCCSPLSRTLPDTTDAQKRFVE